MNTNIAHCGNTKISNFEQVGIDIILINCDSGIIKQMVNI
jgi:hypothetical protein